MVKEAGTPAVANDNPGPDPVDVLPQVTAGNTVAVNGLLPMWTPAVKSRDDGIGAEATDVLSHFKFTAAEADVSLYMTLMSYSVLLSRVIVADTDVAPTDVLQ